MDSARARLAQAAAEENSRALKAARDRADQTSGKQTSGKQPSGGKETPGQPARQSSPPPVSADAVRAAALVKEAEAACQAGEKTAASEKARAAISLIEKQ